MGGKWYADTKNMYTSAITKKKWGKMHSTVGRVPTKKEHSSATLNTRANEQTKNALATKKCTLKHQYARTW